MNGGQLTAVLIVAIVMTMIVLKTRMIHGPRHAAPQPDPDADRMREEIRTLKERIAVLERIATDKSSALEREIDALRDRD